jgi:hypothetical protein
VEAQLILDRYRPLEELGEGGFGTVTLAWDTRMQRRVAIKRLAFPLDERGIPRQPPGLAEARTAALLNHPNIVTVFDFDTDGDEAFIVMEHVDGASLADIVEQLGAPLTLDETAAVVDAVAEALTYAHHNGVLHLDIKPDNILVTRDGRIKVADFGVSELSSASGHGQAWGGTIGYMPLEQLQGRTVAETTDQWALAAVAFEALTGENPFVEKSPQAAIVRLELYEPPAPSSLDPELPAAIDDVLLAALERIPTDRYRDVGAFADALVAQLGDPGAGRASLAEIVADLRDEEADDAPSLAEVGAWDRLRGTLGSALLRGAAAVECGWLSLSGLSQTALERPALYAVVGLVVLAGALAPSLGVLLGVGCLVAGIGLGGSPFVAAGIALIAAVWWWFSARHEPGAAVLPLAAPVFSAARVGFVQPLIAGFALTPGPAAATALAGGALAMLASAVSAQGAPYLWVWLPDAAAVGHYELATMSVRALVTAPGTYIALAGWPAAAALMSWLCGRATRLAATVGAVAGAAVLGGAYLLALEATRALGGLVWTTTPLAVSLGASLILVLLVVALGPPVRAEADEEPSHRFTPDDDEFAE